MRRVQITVRITLAALSLTLGWAGHEFISGL